MAQLSTEQVLGFVLLDLAIILVAARLVGALFCRIGQPRVVGEILAGILLGPTLLGATLWPNFAAPTFLLCTAEAGALSPTGCLFPDQARAMIGHLGQLGLLLFSFLTALSLDRAMLRTRIRGIALVGPGVVLLPVGTGFILGPILATPLFKPEGVATIGFTLFVGALMAATALPVMVRILQERGLTATPLGSTGIAASALATVGLFVAASVAASVAAGAGSEGALLAVGLAVSYLGVMLLVVRPLLARVTLRRAAGAAVGPGLLPVVFVLLLLSGLAAHLAGLTVIVGGFMAGLVLPAHAALYPVLDRALGELTRSVLLPIFLAFSGLATDLTTVPLAAFGGLSLLLLGCLVSKWAGGAVIARVSGLTWAESNVLGILMNCPGVIVLVVALVGVQAGVITDALQAGIVLVALITTAMTGPLLNVFLPRLPATSLAIAAPVRTLSS